MSARSDPCNRPPSPMLRARLRLFGAFTEGMALFASFAMLLNFPRHNKMNGMGQIVSWGLYKVPIGTIEVRVVRSGKAPCLWRDTLVSSGTREVVCNF